MSYTLTLTEMQPVTNDTYRLTFTRPEGFEFESGQCTHWAFDADGWRDTDGAFTMTSQPEDRNHVEFVIKTYPLSEFPDHNGLTEKIPNMRPGDKVIGDEPGGAITDHGAGVFIAGGAGVTPYIPILRRRAMDGALDGCKLIYSNKTEADIILHEEWASMDGLDCVFCVTDQEDAPKAKGVTKAMIDEAFLRDHIGDKDQPFYICGPQAMVNDVRDALKSLGVAEDKIVTENGW